MRGVKMRLNTIIRNARSRELKKLSAKDKTDEVIVDYINLAMIALYSRFQLRTEELVVALKTGKTIYKVDGTDVDVFRNGVQFESDDVMGIIKAFNEEKEISINKDSDPLSVYTVSYDTVQVPYAITGDYISLLYRAAPEEIEYQDSGDGTAVDVKVSLPMHMMEALLCHIGYSAFSSVDGDNQVETDRYLNRFEKAVSELVGLGLVPQDTLDFDLDRKGFMT